MEKQDRINELAIKAWEYRKKFRFLKALPIEIREAAGSLVASGCSVNALAKSLGVNRNTMIEWGRKFEKPLNKDGAVGFSEVIITEEEPSAFEVRLSAEVQGCRVEIRGCDFSLLERLLRKMGN